MNAPSEKHVTIFLDALPRPGVDPTGWRTEQICKAFSSSSAKTNLVLHGTNDGLESLYGLTVETTGLDATQWWKANRSDIVVLCGGGVAHRAVALCRTHRPSAQIIVDGSCLLSLQRPDLSLALIAEAEHSGRDTVASLRRQRDRELLAQVDEIWVCSNSELKEVEAIGSQAKIRVVRPPQIRFPTSSGTRPLVLAAPHREFGDPDLASVRHFIEEIAPRLDPSIGQPLIVTERAFGAWRNRNNGLDVVERNGPLIDALNEASMIVTARHAGPTAWTQLLAARAVGIPIVATPQVALHVDEPSQWDLEIVHSSDIGPAMLRAAARRRVPPRPAAEPTGLQDALTAVGVTAAVDEEEISDWLMSPGTGRRHRMDLKQYRRSRTEAEADPDTDPGTHLEIRPLISILTPVYNTPLDVLEETITSVRTQTYERWQLCLVDDCSDDDDVRALCLKFASTDARITFVGRNNNGGIAQASNTAFDISEGQYVALLDHDDLLRPDALTEVVRAINEFPDVEFLYSDEDKLFSDGSYDHSYAKSGWSPDLHLSYNYVCHFAVFSRALINRIGGWRGGFDGAQDYDLALRATENTNQIVHIPRNLYHWRILPGSTAAGVSEKSGAWAAGQRALTAALDRRGIEGNVEEGLDAGTYNVRYPIVGQPRVGIIIPTRDRYELISECVHGIAENTSWPEVEVMVVNNESTDSNTLEWMDRHNGPVIDYPHQFSYARMMNMAAEQIDCDVLLFLNCDITITKPDWIDAMIGHAQQRRVGAVGAQLSYPDGRIQHEGITVGVGGVAVNTNSRGYFSIGNLVRNSWALTAACLMVRTDVFWEVGGFEERLRVAFNDVDLTLRIHQLGYDLVYQPHAALLHQESALRGSLHPTEDEDFFKKRWGDPLDQDDPYYNPRLSRHAQYYFADEVKQVWLPRGHPLA